jgi:hypothetical protein
MARRGRGGKAFAVMQARQYGFALSFRPSVSTAALAPL